MSKILRDAEFQLLDSFRHIVNDLLLHGFRSSHFVVRAICVDRDVRSESSAPRSWRR